MFIPDTPAGILSRSRPRGVSLNARAPFLSTGVQLCLALQLFCQIRFEPVVALLNSLIATAT